MFGHHIGKSIGMGYVENHHGLADKAFITEGSYEIEVAGERVGAVAQLEPFYDPKSARVKA
jgi:4-methylaminobutanoate oxidase (formaldehyde-forming)